MYLLNKYLRVHVFLWNKLCKKNIISQADIPKKNHYKYVTVFVPFPRDFDSKEKKHQAKPAKLSFDSFVRAILLISKVKHRHRTYLRRIPSPHFLPSKWIPSSTFLYSLYFESCLISAKFVPFSLFSCSLPKGHVGLHLNWWIWVGFCLQQILLVCNPRLIGFHRFWPTGFFILLFFGGDWNLLFFNLEFACE